VFSSVVVHESGQKTWQQHYEGALAAGTFVQTSDGGFAIAGTSADGNVTVIQTNGTGNVEWRKNYCAGFGNAILQSSDGGFAIAAAQASVVGNTGVLIKTDAQGNETWSKVYGGISFLGIVNASDGGYVLLGSSNSTGVQYAKLMKVDSAGNQQWTKNYSSSQASVNMLYALIATADGGYAASGEIQYPVGGETTRQGWFLKTDVNGEEQVNRPFAMDGQTILYSVAQATDGGYFLVGATANSTSSSYAACIIRTDWDGHSLWSQVNQTLNAFNATSEFNLYSVSKTSAADLNYFITGYQAGVGITVEGIKDNGQQLYESSFGVSSQSLTNPTVGHIISVNNVQLGYAWVGHSGESIWLVETYWYTSS
jgi:hypothetical protein